MSNKIKSMDEFYKKYLPEHDRKYPIDMRVSEEEKRHILFHRGETFEIPKTPD